MHQSALDHGSLFFRTYFSDRSSITVVDIGAQNVNGSLKDVCLPAMKYVGVDFVAGKGVDIVLDETDPYKLPFENASLDVVVCSSVFEHSEFFWLLFLEILRVLKPSGLLYLNVPSNGFIHRYPVDSWRFYPDAGMALVNWARHSGYSPLLLESFIGHKSKTDTTLGQIWNDFVAVFVKDEKCATQHSQRMIDAAPDHHEGYNSLTGGARTNTDFFSPDLKELQQAKQALIEVEQRAAALARQLRAAKKPPQRTSAERGPVVQSARTCNIYQIFYSPETRQQLDPGYVPLDNTGQRPDWCEYWPIRTFLLNHELNADEFYGFLSPKFTSKTGLTSQQVREFVARLDASVDVVSFSPFFDQGALFQNIFRQGSSNHANAWSAFVACAAIVAPNVKLETAIMDSRNTVFCNYFLAKPRFWRHWLEKAEQIFAIAEQNDTPLGKELNSGTLHNNVVGTQVKVFFMERLLSLLLLAEPEWHMQTFNPMDLPLCTALARALKLELVLLDSLKIAAMQTGSEAAYMEVYGWMQQRVFEHMLQQAKQQAR